MKRIWYVLLVVIPGMAVTYVLGDPESRLWYALGTGGGVFLLWYIMDVIFRHLPKKKSRAAQNDDDFLLACRIELDSPHAEKALKIRRVLGEFCDCAHYYIRAEYQVNSDIRGMLGGDAIADSVAIEEYLKSQLEIDDLPFLFDSWSGLMIGDDLTVADMIREVLLLDREVGGGTKKEGKNPYR